MDGWMDGWMDERVDVEWMDVRGSAGCLWV